MASRDIFQALRRRDFAFLWVGSLGSSFAMNMQIIARGWLVYELTESPMDLAWVTLSFMLPTVIFSLLGGVLADRLPKRRIIALGQFLNFAATVVLGFIVITGNVTFWDFIWFGFFNGTVLALSMPARQAFVPELIAERLIFTAMALNTTGWNLSRIVGPALAGFLIAILAAGDTSSTWAVGIVFFVIAGLYLMSAITVLGVSRPGLIKEPDGRSPLGDMADALRYVWQRPSVTGLIALSIMPFLFGMPLNTLLPAFNHDVLGGGPDELGLLTSVTGVGAILGSLMLASMGRMRRKAASLIFSALLWGLVIMALAMTSDLLLALAALAIIGWLGSWNMSLNRGLLQMQVDDHMRGRVMSIDMMSHGLMPLGVLPIAAIAEYGGVSAGIMAGGALLAVSILALWLLPSVRQVDLRDGRLL